LAGEVSDNRLRDICELAERDVPRETKERERGERVSIYLYLIRQYPPKLGSMGVLRGYIDRYQIVIKNPSISSLYGIGSS
jgi:hypothetical protein